MKVKATAAGDATKTAEADPKADAEKPKKEKAKRKKRSDFAEGDEGWKLWCEHNKVKLAKRKEKIDEKIDLWEKKKAGEHLVQEAKKLKRLAKLQKQLAAVEAELKAAGIDPAQLK